jgi:hypothetical protein
MYPEEMARLNETNTSVNEAKEAKSKAAYLKELVHRAMHRAVGKLKASCKVSTFSPSIYGSEDHKKINARYCERECEACRPRNIAVSTGQQHGKQSSCSIIDEAASDVDVFRLVDIGKRMSEEELEFWDPLEISAPLMRPYNNPRGTQDSLSPEAAKFYFPRGLQPVTPIEWPAAN